MPIYPTLAVTAAVAVVLVELVLLRTGLFRDRAYWISMAICYRVHDPRRRLAHEALGPDRALPAGGHQRLSPIWDIPLEEYAYAFALLTAVMLTWDHLGRRAADRSSRRRGARCDPAPALRRRLRRHGGGELRDAPLGDARLRLGWHRSHHASARRAVRAQRPVPALLLGARRSCCSCWLRCGSGPCGGSQPGSPPTAPRTSFVHEVYIHRRLSVPASPTGRYLEWLRASHRDHHPGGGEPYGMLLPLVRRRSSAADGCHRTSRPRASASSPGHRAPARRGVGRGRGCSAGWR